MLKGSTDDITSRKLGMIVDARKAVDSLKDDKAVSLEEALKTEMMNNQALINILVAKGLIGQEELLVEIEKLGRARE